MTRSSAAACAPRGPTSLLTADWAHARAHPGRSR
jgi:hypothetical protein